MIGCREDHSPRSGAPAPASTPTTRRRGHGRGRHDVMVKVTRRTRTKTTLTTAVVITTVMFYYNCLLLVVLGVSSVWSSPPPTMSSTTMVLAFSHQQQCQRHHQQTRKVITTTPQTQPQTKKQTKRGGFVRSSLSLSSSSSSGGGVGDSGGEGEGKEVSPLSLLMFHHRTETTAATSAATAKPEDHDQDQSQDHHLLVVSEEETSETASSSSSKKLHERPTLFDDLDFALLKLKRRFKKASTTALLMTAIMSTATTTTTTTTNNKSSFLTLPTTTSTTPSVFNVAVGVPPATAAGYESFTPEQKFVAEAWRTVDATYLDRTFGNQDWFKIRQDLVSKAKKFKTMDEAQQAVSDMMSSLGDKYTRYLPPAKYQSLVDSATGTLAGVGVEIATGAVDTTNGRPIVGDVEPGSPAFKAGLLPNDIFVESDGAKFDDKTTPDDVALKLRGPVNSKVGVTILRNPGQQTKEFILTRQPIQVTSVRSYMGSNKVGVVRIKNFSATTSGLVKDAVAALQKQGAKSFLFDLRGNPGGLLPGGVETASLFLESNKPVVFVVSNKGVVTAEETFEDGMYATPNTNTIPKVTILVDHNTASAAEVFTAALKENGRAQVVGEQTFGKGIIQTIRELSDSKQGGVAVTVARYETPQHNDINKAGIPVDVPTNVDCPKDDATLCVPSKLLL